MLRLRPVANRRAVEQSDGDRVGMRVRGRRSLRTVRAQVILLAFTTGRSSAPYFDDLIGGSHDRVPEVEVPTGRIQILHVPDCPLVDDVVQMVRECQDDSGDSGAPELRVGAYPSPTVVINGLDVTTGESVAGEARCRLDLPTREQILNALARDR